MNHLKSIGFFLGVFALGVVAFGLALDKSKLFYTLQHEAASHGVHIEPKEIGGSGIGFEALEAKVYYNNSLVARFDELDLNLGGVVLRNVAFENSLEQLIGFKIEQIRYGIFSPFTLWFTGEMGEGTVAYAQNEHKIVVKLTPTDRMKSSKHARFFKEEQGVMVYEYGL